MSPAMRAAERAAALTPSGLVTTWFGVGLLPGPRGTWGTFAALPLVWVAQTALGPWGGIVAGLVATALGIWASGLYAARLGLKDPSSAVIDEVAGTCFTLALTPPDPLAWLVGALVFRSLDIWKPWPAGAIDRSLPAGYGIVLDDVVAGLYGLAVMVALGPILGSWL